MIPVAIAACLLCAGPPSEERIHRIEQGLLPAVAVVGEAPHRMTLDDRMAHYDVPAISIAVIDDGELSWTRAWGVRSRNEARAVGPQTLFQAGSLSKPITAAGVVLLARSGQLSLDEPVETWLRSWRLPPPPDAPSAPITLRAILSHSAGLTVHGFRGYDPGAPSPSLVQVLNGEPPANSPPVERAAAVGAELRYSGGGYLVAQQVLEDLSGRPFQDIMRDEVFSLLGMSSSTFEQSLDREAALFAAVGHGPNGRPIPGSWRVFPEQAAAGLWSTSEDLGRFVAWLSNGGRSGPAPEVALAMLQPQSGADGRPLRTPSGAEAGLGLVLDGAGAARRFSHAGSNPGQKAFLIGFPETGDGAVIMANADTAPPLIQEMLRAVAAEYDWPERFQESVELHSVPKPVLDKLAGIYRFVSREDPGVERDITVSAESGALQIVLPDGSVHTARPVGPNLFVDTTSGMRFVVDADGALQAPRYGISATRTSVTPHDAPRTSPAGRDAHQR